MTADVHVAQTKADRPSTLPPLPSPRPPAAEDANLNAVVKSVVDEVVHNAVFSSSLEQEKRKVQGLINNLVSQVRDKAVQDAKDAPKPADETGPVLRAPQQPPVAQGVPLGDHRLRHLGRLPVTWMQTMDSVTVNISVSVWVRKQNVKITFTTGAVRVLVFQDDPEDSVVNINEPLVAPIETAACTWALQDAGDGRLLTLELEKEREQWWARLFMADDPSLYTVVTSSSQSSVPAVSDQPATPAANADDQSRNAGATANVTNTALPNGHAENSTEENRDENDSSTDISDNQSLEDAVKEVVEDVVESVATGQSNKPNLPSSATAVADRSNATRQPPKRLLTEADIVKLVDQCKEQFEKAGPGSAEAALQLGNFYNHGVGVEKNEAEAARLYKFGLQNGALDSSAAFQLGIIYTHGTVGIEADPKEAVRWWQVAATLGNSAAMFNLGVMAMNGTGCDMDPIAALRWWQEATALNPSLKPPLLSKTQLEERVALAAKQKKERIKAAMSPEEKKRRREEALEKARFVMYTSAGVVGLAVSVVAIRYWWRNRL